MNREKAIDNRMLLAIYLAWAFLHLIFLAIGWDGSNSAFYPFQGGGGRIYNTIEDSYGATEFLVYVGTPSIIYLICKLTRGE